MIIPFLDVKAQNQLLKNEILPLWEEILVTGRFIGGEHVDGFEHEFAAACNTTHCVAVNSGTDALRFIFLALGLKPGDEVITVPNTFIATTEAISQAGGTIVFADVDPDTYTIDPVKIEAAVTPKTRGIVPVHLYGQPADMDTIQAIARQYNLWIVEDACQAHLAEYRKKKVGCLGRAAAFSFYPGKNLGACGEGGAVTTDDTNVAHHVRMLRDHGQAKKYFHDLEGYNGRCDALQAAALRVKLKHLAPRNEARRRIAQRYMNNLQGLDIKLPPLIADTLPVFHLFVIQVENRDELTRLLKEKGVETALHYPLSLHLQKAYQWMQIGEGSFPVAEAAARKILSLPMYPEMTDTQVDYVCESMKECLAQLRSAHV